jgi:hypothetical protein
MASTIEVRRRPLRRLRAAVGIGALLVLIGVGVPSMLYRSFVVLSEARRWSDLDPLEARRRTFGAAYSDAIETIRHDLPPDAWYLLVPGDLPKETGWELWVRYDLAPRRPILLRSRGGRGLRGPRGEGAPKWVRWAVVPGDEGVPVLLTREQLLSRRRAR